MPNRLADATSPYLLQHADNPVDWWPWGPEAIAEAKRSDRAILLSIGYAACHWCHVMAHETFEDPEIGALMSERFVCIKVDKEERPDIDRIYMTALQAMTRSGGWPMTMFLTPDLEPFFGGTYFPPEPRHGVPSFRQILDGLFQQWTDRREDCVRHGNGMREMLEQMTQLASNPRDPSSELLHETVAAFADAADPEWGGFGSAPKFPQAPALDFLLARAARGDTIAAPIVRHALERMARGGIFDHLGGGFARYSTDRVWLVPHFEKMLSDNAQLLALYARAGQVFDEPAFTRTASMTADFLLRELELEGGGFASSLDADSLDASGAMHEGAFYAFGYDELIAGAADDMPIAIAVFALAGPGNWEGKTVLWRPHPDEDVAAQIGIPVDEVTAAVDRVTAAWFAQRSLRPRPARDDKMITAWNGMAIGALAEASSLLERPDLLAAARRAADAVLTRLRDADGRLMRSWRDGRADIVGFLDDHACVIDGLLTLAGYDSDPRWTDAALELARSMIERFEDPRGGFHETAVDGEALLVRPKEFYDDATAAPNATAANALLRLAAVTGDRSATERAMAYLRMITPALERAPTGFAGTLRALDRALADGRELVSVGTPDEIAAFNRAADQRWDPDLVRLAAAPGKPRPIALLAGRLDASPRAYLCTGGTCLEPAGDGTALIGRFEHLAGHDPLVNG